MSYPADYLEDDLGAMLGAPRRPASGFAALGQLLGGGIDRQGAFLAGQVRSAKTQEALERARLVRAQAGIAGTEYDALNRIATEKPDFRDPNYNPVDVIVANRGPSYAAAAQGRLSNQEFANRADLANELLPANVRQARGDAIQGKFQAYVPVAGTEGYYDATNPSAGIVTSPLGESQIGLRGQQQATSRSQELLNTAKREHPEDYRSGLGAFAGTPDSVESTANAIANYQIAPMGANAMRTQFGANVMKRVIELNPEYQANEYAAHTKGYKDFATGVQGRAAQSFGVALSHLETLDKLSDALNNGNLQLFNRYANEIATQTGSVAPGNFDAAKKIVADEIVKAIVGSGGGVADREEAARVISSASSPQQLKGVIATYKELMSGQLAGLKATYEHATGRKDFAKILSPKAREYLLRHQAEFGDEEPAAAPASAPARTFASEAQAEAAHAAGTLKVGDRIVINGVSGTWQ